MTSRIPLVRTSSESTVRRPGKAPEGAIRSPSPGRHATTRSRRRSSSSSSPTADGSGTRTPVPSPHSQSFSRDYGSILPTSLAYIPSTRGCSPWRPDAVMSTTGRGRHSVLRIFKGRRGHTGHHATCGALPAAGPYLWLSRFQGGQAVSAQLGTVARLPVHPASPVLLTKNGPLGALDSLNSRSSSSYPEGNFGGNQQLDGSISLSPLYPSQTNDLHVSIAAGLHHLLGPDRYAHSNPSQKIKPVDSHTCQTPWSVFQDGSNGEPAGQHRERAVAEARRGRALTATIGATAFHRHINCSGFGRRLNPHRSAPRVDRRTGIHHSTSDRGASPAPIRFPPDNFKHSLTLFSKSFSSFPRGTCSLSVSRPYLALDGIYRPIGAAFPNNPTRRQRLVVRQGPGTTGLSPSPAPLSRGLGPGPPLRTLLQTTIRTTGPSDSQVGLFPVRSPLLGESL
ncbi:PREDICTED: uncharacterized protein LOC105976418 [Erythranthe guttata]|uniref:uncharacterized protein LOC105976418 n=1 Tax=Erythranthe guttata TaxID=4155 RepID=UPI00064E0456|nr:PREDICTED: uncharacterized protein LOC105976418 [Erythranthe guttata]|eukprot:XP_012857141.1 PREDICTED: uncharacterized protein LOC105976418 [Erythranthe guttata]